MPDDATLVLREACGACDGAGQVDHPDWKRLRTDFTGMPLPASEELVHWFREEAGWDAGGLPPLLPPETVECDACLGSGRVETTLTLGELIELVAASLAAVEQPAAGEPVLEEPAAVEPVVEEVPSA
jgi:hypothetical protein